MMEIKSSKTKLFLIELIVVLFFFSVSSVVCVNLFARARQMSINSADTTNAMLRAQYAAETIRAADDPRSAAIFAQAEASAAGYTMYYDEAWGGLPGAEESAYQMNVTFTQSGQLLKARITVRKGDAELLSINTARFMDSIG